MIESLIGVLVGFLTFALAELRRRRKKKTLSSGLTTDPPPPARSECNRCFFYKQHRKRLKEDEQTRKNLLN